MRRIALALLMALVAANPLRADDPPAPVKLLIITGDNVSVHDWKATSAAMADILSAQGKARWTSPAPRRPT